MLLKCSLRAEAVIAVVTDEMIFGMDPVMTTFLVRIKVASTGEAIVMVFILPEVVQESGARVEIGPVRVMIPAYLEMADVVAARIGDMLVLCQIVDKLSIASLAVIVHATVDQVLED